MKKEILRMENVITEGNDMTNLDNFNLHMFQGEIFGLIGVNSHGKNKLIQLLCKNSEIIYGRIYFANELVNSYYHRQAAPNRVYVLEQESKLVNNLTVTDNVFVLRKGFKKYCINKKVLRIQLMRLLDEIEVVVDPKAICLELSEYERCVVEVLKAIIQGTKLIVVNDISNVLSALELENFKKLLIKVASKGYSIMYIGNHHEEVFPICNRVAFMKDGKVIKVFDKKEMLDEKVIPYTIPFEDTNKFKTSSGERRNIYFYRLTTGDLKEVSFEMQQGECIVLYDKSKKLQLDMIACLCGEKEIEGGFIGINGEVIDKKNLRKKLGNQIAVIGEQAISSMLYYDMSYIDNLCFLLDKKTRKSRISQKVKHSIQKEYYNELGEEVYATDIRDLDKKSLYNIIYYRIHLVNPKIVFIVQPFSNADMYVRRHIAQLIRILKRKGIAVIILAVTISDCLFVADKLLLLEEGIIQKEYLPDTFSHIRLSI